MADHRPPPPAPQPQPQPQPHEQDTTGRDLDAAYAAARKEFKAHLSICYASTRRGTDCYDVATLKQRMRDAEARAASQ